MNIVFFGSAQFGLPALEALEKSGHRILCVVTQPDRKKGRGMPLTQTPVKAWALMRNIDVLQPHDANTAESVAQMKKFAPELFVVIAYGQILSQEVLDLPSIAALNVHASLLPAYRGAAPINWALIRGEKTTGISVIKMVRAMDAGPVLLQCPLPIGDDDDALTLEEKLARDGARGLIESIRALESGSAVFTPQDERARTFAPKLYKELGNIPWELSAVEIMNRIRGCAGWPGAYTYLHGVRLNILKAHASCCQTQHPHPGEVLQVTKHGITVATGNELLVLERVQPEGKKNMSIAEFIAGHKLSPGVILRGKK